MSLWLSGTFIGVTILLVALAAIVSGFETAVFLLRSKHATGLVKGDSRMQARLRFVLRESEQSQIRILILSAFLNLSLILICIYLISHWEFLKPHPRVAVACALGGIIVLCDLLPKVFAMVNPATAFRLFVRTYLFLRPLISPIASGFQRTAEYLENLLFPASRRPQSSYTEDEYETLVEIHREEGTLNESESEIIAEIVKLGNKTAKDCMTARVNAFALPADLRKDELFAQLKQGHYWKVPLYRETPDKITGILDVRVALQSRDGNLQRAIEPPVFVPETMEALTVFQDYLREPHSIVVVLDEYGGTEGVLTHEDIIQEFISDPNTMLNGEETDFEFLSSDRLVASGAARLDEVGDALGVDLTSDGLDTIGGLVFNRLGHLPLPGERLDLGPVKVVVRQTNTKRIKELLIERN
ncbi:MAG: hemolysin family protein [Verrucomicrobiota bacterium]